MFFVFWRVFLRIFLLIGILFSLFGFLVAGYRYDKNVGFIRKAVVFNIRTLWSESSFIKIDNSYLLWTDDTLTLYWLEWGCMKIVSWFEKRFICVENGDYKNIIFFNKDEISIEKTTKKLFVNNLSFKENADPLFTKNIFYWEWIEFKYLDNWDLLYRDDIGYHKLINIGDADVIGGDKKYIYLYKDKEFYKIDFSI